jgi:threonine dehydratase
VHHQRKFTRLPLESTEVEFVLQTRNHAHGAEVITALHANGFHARLNDASD